MANLLIIKQLAKQKGITLKTLATRVNLTEQGLHKAISANSTSIDTLERIAAQLDVSPHVFFGADSTTPIKGDVVKASKGSIAETGDHVTQINADPKLIEAISRQSEQLQKLVDTNSKLTERLLELLPPSAHSNSNEP